MDQPFEDQDWEAVAVLIKHAQPEMVENFEKLRQKEPMAAQRHESYRLRSGGAISPSRLTLEEVMRERFGSATGRVS